MLLSVLSVEPYGMKHEDLIKPPEPTELSVLSVEPYGMKLLRHWKGEWAGEPFSALGRAVWDETDAPNDVQDAFIFSFSALGRAVWDETLFDAFLAERKKNFQCSRSSRMG